MRNKTQFIPRLTNRMILTNALSTEKRIWNELRIVLWCVCVCDLYIFFLYAISPYLVSNHVCVRLATPWNNHEWNNIEMDEEDRHWDEMRVFHWKVEISWNKIPIKTRILPHFSQIFHKPRTLIRPIRTHSTKRLYTVIQLSSTTSTIDGNINETNDIHCAMLNSLFLR